PPLCLLKHTLEIERHSLAPAEQSTTRVREDHRSRVRHRMDQAVGLKRTRQIKACPTRQEDDVHRVESRVRQVEVSALRDLGFHAAQDVNARSRPQLVESAQSLTEPLVIETNEVIGARDYDDDVAKAETCCLL